MFNVLTTEAIINFELMALQNIAKPTLGELIMQSVECAQLIRNELNLVLNI